MSEPRTWKWSLPGGVFVLLVVVSFWLYELTYTNTSAQYWLLFTSGLAVLTLAMALTNWWRVISDHWEDLYERHAAANSMTPLVLLSNNLKQMNPEAVKTLNRFGVRTSWQVRLNNGERDWVLADTNVHFGFIEFVLDHSGVALYPKNRFAEGSKKWDPDGLVTDREQYEEFERWLFARLMVTRSHGDFKPAEFIPPWTPKLIMETMGFTGEQELYQPEETVRRDLNQQPEVKVNGNGRKPAQQAAPMEPEMTAAEMAAIAAVEETYSKEVLGNGG